MQSKTVNLACCNRPECSVQILNGVAVTIWYYNWLRSQIHFFRQLFVKRSMDWKAAASYYFTNFHPNAKNTSINKHVDQNHTW